MEVVHTFLCSIYKALILFLRVPALWLKSFLKALCPWALGVEFKCMNLVGSQTFRDHFGLSHKWNTPLPKLYFPEMATTICPLLYAFLQCDIDTLSSRNYTYFSSPWNIAGPAALPDKEKNVTLLVLGVVLNHVCIITYFGKPTIEMLAAGTKVAFCLKPKPHEETMFRYSGRKLHLSSQLSNSINCQINDTSWWL